jgi:CPA2 family monovalent cation:H+ antiporter-2
VFFLSVGMLLDPAFLAREPLLVLAGVVGVVVLKATTGTVAGRLMGAALPVAVASAVLKSQIGEFSFVLEQVGRKAGLTPADLGQDGVQAFLATTVVLMTLTPGLGPLGDGLARRLEARSRMGAGRRQGPGGASAGPGDEVGLPGADHVVLAGYGDGARALVPALVRSSVPFVVVTLDPQGALQAEGLGVPVVRGDSARAGTLEQAGVRRARALVIADHQADPAARIAQLARSLNPHVALIVRLADEHGVDELAAAGVDRIVTGTRASRAGLAETVLAELAVVEVDSVFDPAPSFDLDAVVRTAVSPASSCTHRDQVRPVLPSAPGCEECLQSGDRWVHLRICSTCGHVGCCDDSPNRHARAHWAGSAHPIMRSIEPGERWAWCFQDQLEP